MCKIIFITLCILSYEVSAAEKFKISIGIISDFPKSKIKNENYEIEFVKAASEIKVVNMLVNGKLDMAILPPSYAIKAAWQARTHTITYKLGAAYQYLVSPKNKEKIHVNNSPTKVIGFVQNSGSEFFLNEFFGPGRFKKMYLNSLQLERSLDFKNLDAVLMDASAFFSLKDKDRYLVEEIYAGPWVMVAMWQDREIIKKKKFTELFKSMGIELENTSKEDLDYVERLHKSLNKSEFARDAYDVSNQYRKVQ